MSDTTTSTHAPERHPFVVRQEAGVDDRLNGAISSAESDLRITEQALREYGARIQDRVARALRSVEAGEHINSLGELQGSALDFDRTCAIRQEQVRALQRLLFLIPEDVAAAGGHTSILDAR